MQFLGNFKGKPPILSTFLAQPPPLKAPLGPPSPKSWIRAWTVMPDQCVHPQAKVWSHSFSSFQTSKRHVQLERASELAGVEAGASEPHKSFWKQQLTRQRHGGEYIPNKYPEFLVFWMAGNENTNNETLSFIVCQ